DGNEFQSGGVDAITQPAFVGGTVVKHVAQVRVGNFGADFSALHAESAIFFLNNFGVAYGLGETGPATTGIELVQGAEQGLARNDVDVKSGFVVIPVLIVKGGLGAA